MKLLLALFCISTVAQAAERNVPADTVRFTRRSSAPSSPPAGTVFTYGLDADGKLYMKDSSGSVYNFLSPASVGTSGQAAISGGSGQATWFAPTAGSVLFAGSSGILAQDNANLFWDDTNNRLGIGVAGSENTVTIGGVSYGSTLSVHAEGGTDAAELAIHRHSDTAGASAAIIGARTRGTEASETVVQSGDRLARILAVGHDGTDAAAAAAIDMEVDGTPGNNDMPGRIVFSVTPDGSQTLAEALKINQTKVVTMAGYGAGAAQFSSAGVISSGTLPVSSGGTGATTLTDHGVLLGSGTGAVTPLAEAAAGTVLGGVASSDPAFTATPALGIAGTTKGTISFAGNTSGVVTIQPKAAAGTYTLTLPDTDGNASDFLQTDGSGGLSWAAGGAGSLYLRTWIVHWGGATEGTNYCGSSPCTIYRQMDSANNTDTVSSVSRTGTGDYTINITVGRCSSAPSCNLMCNRATGGGCASTGMNVETVVKPTATAFRFYTDRAAGANSDGYMMCSCIP